MVGQFPCGVQDNINHRVAHGVVSECEIVRGNLDPEISFLEHGRAIWRGTWRR